MGRGGRDAAGAAGMGLGTLQSTAGAVWIKAEANGKAYYWRSDTNEVRWDRPPSARKLEVSPLRLGGLSDVWASPIAGSGHQEPLPPVSVPPRSTGTGPQLPPPPRLPYLSSHLAKKSNATARPQCAPRALASDEADDEQKIEAAFASASATANSHPRRAAGDDGHTAPDKRVPTPRRKAMLEQVRALGGTGFEMAEELQRRRNAAASMVGIDLGGGADQAKARREREAEEAREAEEERLAQVAKKRAEREHRQRQQAEAKVGGMQPLSQELAGRIDALRSDEAQRAALARRVQESQPDRGLVAARILKTVNAVNDAAPARRSVLQREKAQRREAARAEVAGRLRAAQPEPPASESPRVVRKIDAAHLARYRNESTADGRSEPTQKQRIRQLAADIGRML